MVTGCTSYIDNYDNYPSDGDLLEIGEGTISSSNREIIVTNEQSVYSGLQISVNDDYSGPSVDFTIESGNLPDEVFNEYFNPLDEMLRINFGGETSENIFFVKVPISTAEGEIPVAFNYNETTGLLDPLPILSHDEESITFAARHFIQIGYGSELKSSTTNNDKDYANVLIGSFVLTSLELQDVIMSDFQPGSDDWDFGNWGSVMEPDGNCAGMMLSSLFYYDYKIWANQVELSHLYDRDPKIWEDNTLGIRLVSEVQNNCLLVSIDKIWMDFFKHPPYAPSGDFYDKYQKSAFANASAQLLISRKPIYTSILPRNSLNNGHAVLIIGINRADSILYIADPNFPGETRIAELKPDGYFDYLSGVNARESNNILYERFLCLGYSQMASWQTVADNWKELTDGTIGDQRFPSCDYKVTYNQGQADESTNTLGEINKMWLDGLSVSREHTTLRISCDASYPNGNSESSNIWIWENSKWLATSARDKNYIDLDLEQSDLYNSTIGIFISQPTQVNGVDTYEWIDFKWMNISEISITPEKMVGTSNTEYTWEITLGNPPTNTRFEWNFGDGSETTVIKNSNTSTHIYFKGGTYPIVVTAYDDDTNESRGVATGSAVITDIPVGQRLVYANLTSGSNGFQTTGDFGPGVISVGNTNGDPPDSNWVGLMNWDGNSFSADYTETEEIDVFTARQTSVKITGKISDDHTKLLSFYSRIETKEAHPDHPDEGEITTKIHELGLKNIPIHIWFDKILRGIITDTDLSEYVDLAYWSYTRKNDDPVEYVFSEIKSINLNDPELELEIVFHDNWQ